jgi:uncharacterized membrane protein (UPF0182 family)
VKLAAFWIYVMIGWGVGFSIYKHTETKMPDLDIGGLYFISIVMGATWPVSIGTLLMQVQLTEDEK